MDKTRAKAILSGKPKTKLKTHRNGTQSIKVYPRALGPRMAKVTKALTLASTACMTFCSVGAVIWLHESALIFQLSPLAVPVPFYFGTKAFSEWWLSRQKSVHFSAESITFWSGLKRRKIDVRLDHNWVLHPHPKTDKEAREIELKCAKRPIKWYTRPIEPYFGQSYIVSLEVLGQRNDLMCVYTHEKAQKIFSRLSAVSEIVKGFNSGNEGIALTVEQDWANQAGGLMSSSVTRS